MRMRTLGVAVFCVGFADSCADPKSGQDLDAQFETDVRGRASIEFPCPLNQLTVTPLPGDAFRVTGCGLLATYECEYSYAQGSNFDRYEYVCRRAAQDFAVQFDGGP